MTILLEVKNLITRFHTPEGTVFAVNGVSFSLDEGGTLAVVGESGCGKSVTMMSLLRLIPMPPGEIVSGCKLSRSGSVQIERKQHAERHPWQGNSHGLPGSNDLGNPVLTIGRQLTEPLRVHLNYQPDQAPETRRRSAGAGWYS